MVLVYPSHSASPYDTLHILQSLQAVALYGLQCLALVWLQFIPLSITELCDHNIYAEKEGVGQTLPGEVGRWW